MTTKTSKLEPGDVVHWTRSGIIFRLSDSVHAASEVSQRGTELTITEAILDAGADRNGQHSMWDLVDDDEGQVTRWGSVVFGRGAADGITFYEPGSTEADVAYGAARSAAWAQGDPERRAQALAALKAEFGSPVTSRTIRTEGPR